MKSAAKDEMIPEEPKRTTTQKIIEAKQRAEGAKRAHAEMIESLSSQLEAAKTIYQKEIDQRKKEVESASAPYDGLVMTVGPISLYGNRVIVGDEEIQLDPSIEVDVATSGNTYSETRVTGGGSDVGGAVVGAMVAGAAGAVVGGNKKVSSEVTTRDSRKLFVSFISEGGPAVAELDPNLELEARKLAAMTKYKARTVSERKEAVAEAVSLAEGRLRDAVNNTSSVEELQKQLTSAKEDTSEIDAAEAAYRELLDNINPEEYRSERRSERKNLFLKIYPVVASILSIFFFFGGIPLIVSFPQDVVGGTTCLLLADFLVVSSVSAFRQLKANSQ